MTRGIAEGGSLVLLLIAVMRLYRPLLRGETVPARYRSGVETEVSGREAKVLGWVMVVCAFVALSPFVLMAVDHWLR